MTAIRSAGRLRATLARGWGVRRKCALSVDLNRGGFALGIVLALMCGHDAAVSIRWSARSSSGAPRARRCDVPHESLAAFQRSDYADAFALHTTAPDDRTPEQAMRLALEGAPRWLRWTILVAHRYVLRLHLGPASSPDHVLGWRLVSSTDELAVLQARGPLLHGILVCRQIDPATRVFSTFLAFQRPVTRKLWVVVGPVHRRIAPWLLERGVVAPRRVRQHDEVRGGYFRSRSVSARWRSR